MASRRGLVVIKMKPTVASNHARIVKVEEDLTELEVLCEMQRENSPVKPISTSD